MADDTYEEVSPPDSPYGIESSQVPSEYPEFEDVSEDDEILSQDLSEYEASLKVTARFSCPRSEVEMTSLEQRQLADSTKNKCKWAVTMYEEWVQDRNKVCQSLGQAQRFSCNLQEMTVEEMNYTLCRFITETRKVNGNEYPASTLYDIVASLQLHLQQNGVEVKLLTDPVFKPISNTLDGIMRERASSGIGTNKKQAQVITEDEEDVLWDKDILGGDNPQQLLDTVLYLIGLNFALRAGNEHRALRHENSQLRVVHDSRGKLVLRYTEDISKVHHGGIKHRKRPRKVVDAYENTDNPSRCIIALYQKYCQLCPPNAVDFYLRPLTKPRPDQWYSIAPIGIHKITSTVQRLTSQAGLSGFRSNHSLRASAATRLFRQNVDDQLIRETTGHSSDAVQAYKRTSEQQKEGISRVIQGRRRPHEPPAATVTTSDSVPTLKARKVARDLSATITVNCQINL